MKSVLISIQPRYCEKIASGKKTVEVRKTAPKIPTPFKCYIYQTKVMADNTKYGFKTWARCGKVIGEFVCDKIYEILPHGDGYSPNQYECGWKYDEGNACLSFNQMNRYLGAKVGYGWHISNLKIYDKPKELAEFFKPCPFPSEDCDLMCPHAIGEYHGDGISGDCEFIGCDNKITRPPQSWMYVEEYEAF